MFIRIVVGWHYNLPFSAVRIYYSYTSDNPDYIIGYNEVYMKDGYDYKSDIFVIEDTDIGIVFSDAFKEKKVKINKIYENTKVSFNWHSQRHTELMTKLDIILFDDVYYVNIRNDNLYMRYLTNFSICLLKMDLFLIKKIGISFYLADNVEIWYDWCIEKCEL